MITSKFLGFLTMIFLSPTFTTCTVIRSVPGYPGNLPFRLHTGYIGVGKEEQVQLFYYFVESERDPKSDPLVLWLTGGPGASGLSTLVAENGPLHFNYSADWRSEIPKFQLNPYSWTKAASIIYIDQPVGTGFSYATTLKGYYTDDNEASQQVYEFLKKWLQEYVEFKDNPLYISGESQCGMVVPVVVQEILNGNKAGFGTFMNLKGYTLGNPFTIMAEELSSRYKYARRVSLLSDELYEATTESCHGNYSDVDPRNTRCLKTLQAVLNNLDQVPLYNILEPKCIHSIPPNWWRCYSDEMFFKWGNSIKVQEALHTRRGTKVYWERCNRSLAYTETVENTFYYHKNFTKEIIHALIYSGDQDMVVPYIKSIAWIRKLNLPVISRWKPWFTDNSQVAGYTTKYSNGRYHLTFATGAGHTAPEYKPQETFIMFTKWLKMNTLD